MTREELKEKLIAVLPGLLNEALGGMFEISFQKEQRVGGEVELLTIGMSGSKFAPAFYFEEIEKEVVDSDFEDWVQTFAQGVVPRVYESENAKEYMKNPEQLCTVDFIRKNIFFQLISKENNLMLREEYATRDYLDMMLLYRVLVAESEKGTKSFMLPKKYLAELGLTEDELFNVALCNTQEKFPAKFMTISPYDFRCRTRFVEEMEEFSFEENPLLIVTNSRAAYGAATALYDGVLATVAEVAGSDLLVLPCSIHEIIVIPLRDEMDINYYNDGVCETNEKCVLFKEQLSNHAYIYRRELNKIECLE